MIFTARNEVGARLCFYTCGVILFTGRGLPQCMLGSPRQEDPPGKADTSPAQYMLGDAVNKRAVCILLECNSFLLYFSVSERIKLHHHIPLRDMVSRNLYSEFWKFICTSMCTWEWCITGGWIYQSHRRERTTYWREQQLWTAKQNMERNGHGCCAADGWCGTRSIQWTEGKCNFGLYWARRWKVSTEIVS